MIVIYETRFFGPTDNHGQRIKVTNTWTGKSKWHAWDYSVNGGPAQHQHAVRECAVAWNTVHIGGETKHGYLFAVELEGNRRE